VQIDAIFRKSVLYLRERKRTVYCSKRVRCLLTRNEFSRRVFVLLAECDNMCTLGCYSWQEMSVIWQLVSLGRKLYWDGCSGI